MTTWAIGDLQGCLEPFDCLLEKIRFRSDRDRLLLTGDLVARGPDSLGTLRRVHALRDNLACVLGNHDLHLLALARGGRAPKARDADLQPILEAADRETLLDWLQSLPLLHEEPTGKAVLVHAGIPPLWTLEQARDRAAEVASVLRSERAAEFFIHMYGSEPAGWHDDLSGPTRWRVITNYFTRMRFVDRNGELDLTSKGEADSARPGFVPWFEHPDRRPTGKLILFGHWAALQGQLSRPDVEALDSGCVWGGRLTALSLEDRQRVNCHCRNMLKHQG